MPVPRLAASQAAATVTNPIDVVKVKLQLDNQTLGAAETGQSVTQRCWQMVRKEGAVGLFTRGLVRRWYARACMAPFGSAPTTP